MKVKNNTAQEGTWAGQIIGAGQYYTIVSSIERLSWQNNNEVVVDIANGNLIMNDEFTDLTNPAEGLQYLLGG